jgi:hypothetical protein
MHFTARSIELIHERTTPGTFQIHVFDNGSDRLTQDFLYGLLKSNKIASLHLDSRNTGCLYNKAVFHAMTESKNTYYVVTDNDVYPPKLSPDWLQQMISIMDSHPEIAFLAPQLPPQFLQTPHEVQYDVVYCAAVGNTLKVVRKDAYPINDYLQEIGTYGDDGIVSEKVTKKGFKVAFCRNIFCYHAGQTINWGYKSEEVAMDPRKKGYGKPFEYTVEDWDTYRPEEKWKI